MKTKLIILLIAGMAVATLAEGFFFQRAQELQVQVATLQAPTAPVATAASTFAPAAATPTAVPLPVHPFPPSDAFESEGTGGPTREAQFNLPPGRWVFYGVGSGDPAKACVLWQAGIERKSGFAFEIAQTTSFKVVCTKSAWRWRLYPLP